MKAMFIAMMLILFVISFKAVAQDAIIEPGAAPPVAQVIDKINLNNADVQTLTNSFKGIGKKRALAIVKYREEHRGFTTIAELANVRGIGSAFVNKNLEQLQAIFVIK